MNNNHTMPYPRWQRSRLLLVGVATTIFLLVALIFLFGHDNRTRAIGDLTVEIIAGYNLVVDSNVLSPSTYAPSVATVAGRICNVGASPVNGVQAFIGHYDPDGNGNPADSTPGIYPSRGPGDPGFNTQYPHLVTPGRYFFNHVGGRLGTGDAARMVGTLAAGECQMQYWHFTYPRRSNLAASNDNAGPDPVWGQTNNVSDDLSLSFDVWASDDTGAHANNARWTMTMRNEISAMANKIRPNPDGHWFNTDTTQVAVGEVITSNGILYTLGNVRHGFDNDGNFTPDYNAWMQPVGDPGYDPTCFRLIRTSGVLTVSRSAGQPNLIIPFDDRNLSLSTPYGGPLYFTNMPPDNTGVRGEVFYTFLSLNGPCSTSLSPYQEVASGYDNEKFNGDYGTGIPPVGSAAPLVTIDKSSAPTNIPLGSITTYNLPFVNSGTTDFGLGLSSGGTMPLVLEDTVPQGMQYVGGSATFNLTYLPNSGVTRRYSTDSGASWSLADPGDATSAGPDNLVKIQWWLNDALPAGSTGSAAQFQARVPLSYTGTPFIENCAQASLGGAFPFAEACTQNVVPGNNSIGDTVWSDNGAGGGGSNNGVQDGTEAGIANITLTLYWDRNGNGIVDDDDFVVTDTTTGAGGAYNFPNLPDGYYIVIVDAADPDLPTGYGPTTPQNRAVPLDPTSTNPNPVNYTTADFGFGPSLSLTKNRTSLSPAYVGETVQYTINLNNNLPGDGTAQGFCTYTLWATVQPPADSIPASGSGNGAWQNIPAGLLGRPDNNLAYTNLGNNDDTVGISGFNLYGQTGAITGVRLLAHVRELKNLNASANEFLRLIVFRNNASSQTYTYDGLNYFTGPTGTDYVINQILTGSWTWSDFQNNLTEVQAIGSGTGSNRGDVGLDAIAYVITTDQQCGGAATTITELPLTDTYDPAYLQFISAEPLPSSQTPGTITWDNLGPLYAGGLKSVTVTFRALATVASTTNTGASTNGRFGNGRTVNDATGAATLPIATPGSIAGVIWAESSVANEWTPGTGYNPSDSRIPGVTMELYGCYAPVINFTQLQLLTPTTAGATNQPCDGSSNNGSWRLLATQQTAANGSYLFGGLRPGYYNVRVVESTLPPGLTGRTARSNLNTTSGDGTGVACGACTQGAAGVSWLWNVDSANLGTFNDIVSGENVPAVSFGYRDPDSQGAITGYIWNDQNADGIWDPDETPIRNISVYLCTSTPCTSATPGAILTTTDSNGRYTYGNLNAGTYYVGVTPPASMSQSGDPDVPGANCSPDCNNQTNAITLAARQVSGPYNFGYTGGLSIGDTVYADWNGSGAQDSGEEGIGGVQVLLYQDRNGNGLIDSDDPLLNTQTTAANGFYQFTNLAGNGNQYVVRIVAATIPAGYVQTADPGEVGLCVICDGRHPVTLTTADISTVDFGYQPRGFGAIGDTVWRDSNANGIQEPGELPAGNVQLLLYQDQNGDGILDPEDALAATISTDVSGSYNFTNLAAGNYIVQVAAANFGVGQPLAAQTLTNSGAAYNPGQNSYQVTLGASEIYTAADFGYASSAIGDFIWRDNNGNGDQDPGEPGIPGVTVYLCFNTPCHSGTAVATTATAADGYYAFTGLLPRTGSDFYVVAVDTTTLPAAYSQTGDPDLTAVCSGADCDSASTLTLALGQIDRSRDFGYLPPGVIGDTLWLDGNGNQLRDPDETGISSITVRLCTTPACTLILATTTTDINGYYTFADQPDGTYFVQVDTTDPDFPAGVVNTYDPDGVLDSTTQVILSGGVVTSVGGAPCADCDLDADFGYQLSGPFSISGAVFYDANDNGAQDPAETFTYANVMLYLWFCGADNNCATTGDNRYVGATVTDAAGDYLFANLPAGTYVVSVNSNAPNVIDLDPTITSTPITYRPVTIGPNATDVDFGFLSMLDLGDLPDSYRTTLDNDGARHVVPPSPTLYLGMTVSPDHDPNGQVSAVAGRTGLDGDDGDGQDDEDGAMPRNGGAGAFHWGGGVGHIEVDVVGAGCLLVWVDWDNNGLFDAIPTTGGRSELVLLQPVSSGIDQPFSFPSPTLADYGGAYPTELFARLRLFPPDDPRFGNMAVDGSGCPTLANNVAALNDLAAGIASAGEVEDYQWQFLAPTAVTLQTIQATTAAAPAAPLALLLLLAVATTAVLFRRQRK